jgi:NDP-sugar pyrophosphorylase family protein
MQMVILAGGLGTRLGKRYEKVPKSMIQILGKPFLQYQIELLKENEIKRLLLCIGHLGDQIKTYFNDGSKFGIDIQYSEEGADLLGTGGALKKAEPFLDEHFFLMWGDSYLLLDYIDIRDVYFKTGCEGLMVVYKNYNDRVKSNVIVEEDKIALYDKWNSYDDMIYIDNGLSVLNKVILDEIPSNKVFAVEKIFKKWSQEGKLAAYETEQRFYEIGSNKGLMEFKALVSRKNSREEIE